MQTLFFCSIKKVLLSRRYCAGCFKLMVLLLAGSTFTSTLFAQELPAVSGVSFDGQVITWDAQDGAAGYNIHSNIGYLATVTDGTAFSPDSPGTYSIVAFDGNGNFSPFMFSQENRVVISGDANLSLPAPQNVTGITFSSTAGEITWDRDPSRDLAYSISLNNELLGTTGGTSFWVDTLTENADNRVSVSAASNAGVTSQPVTLLFDTSAAEFPMPALPVDSNSSGSVAAPRNAFAEVYSSSRLELFWDRAQTSENIVATEVFRDGVFVRNSNGNSLVDDADFSVPHVYELIAVNDLGLRSAPTIVNSEPFFDSYNELFQPLLEGIDAVVNVSPIQFGFTGIESILLGSVPFGFTELASENIDVNGQSINRTSLACESGSLTYETTGIPEGTTDFQFDDCLFGENTFEGRVVVTITGETETFFTDDFPEGLAGNLDFTSSFDYRDFRIEDEDTVVVLNGERLDNNTITDELIACGSGYNNFNYRIAPTTDDGSVIVTDVTLNQATVFSSDAAGGPSTFTTRFSAVAPWTEGRLVEAQATDIFSGNNDPFGLERLFYSTGTLFAESDNGDLLTLLAGTTGSNEQWFAEATTATGTNSAFDNWGQLIDLPRLELIDCEG